jgi:hypothetical protein
LPVFEYLQQHPLDMEQWSGSVRVCYFSMYA